MTIWRDPAVFNSWNLQFLNVPYSSFQKKLNTGIYINIYFDKKRKLSPDSAMKDKVKTFKKDKEKENS